MINKITLVIIFLLLIACQRQDNDLVVVSLGGVHAKAQALAFYKPFEAMSHVDVVGSTYNGEMGKIRSMIETHRVDWDVVQVESANLIRGCSEGLFEPIDKAKLGNANLFIADTFSECGVGFFTWSIIVAYDTNKLKEAPASWQDFWDVKKFPGYRGLQRSPMIALEAALLADGVKPADIYQQLTTAEGVDRAFNKLAELKPYIKWWDKGSQPLPMLLAGDVVMTSTFNGRAVIAKQEGKAVGLMWRDSFYDMDHFAIVKGSSHKELAEQFIAFSIAAEPQEKFTEYSKYGFVNKATIAMIDPELLMNISNDPDTMQYAHRINANFWVEYGESLVQRFNVWASQ